MMQRQPLSARQYISELLDEGSSLEDYAELVGRFSDYRKLVRNQETARNVYNDCVALEKAMKQKIRKMGRASKPGCATSSELVGLLEKQEKITAEIFFYAKDMGWELLKHEPSAPASR